MLLFELTKNKLIDYHDSLSSKIWEGVELKSEVLVALKRIANAFCDTLDVPNDAIVDIIITGSLCNYNYTKYSDIDLHVILDYSLICDGCEAFNLQDCMDAKKSLWNQNHDITIYGIDVELYAQDVNDDITGNAGVFSVMNNRWIKIPEKLSSVEYDETLVNSKAKRIMSEIDQIIEDQITDQKEIDKLKEKIQNMRKSGLERTGEFSIENLVFKVLRNSGYLEKLHDYKIKAKELDLSI